MLLKKKIRTMSGTNVWGRLSMEIKSQLNGEKESVM